MLNAILRWLLPLAALLLLGPIAGSLTVSLHAPDGGPETSLLLSSTPLKGILAALGVFALAAAAGGVTARLLTINWGFFVAGLVIAWAAWGTGHIDQILRRTGSASAFWVLALEGLLVGLFGVITAAVITAVARRAPPDAAPAADDPGGAPVALLALAFAIVAGAAGAWLIAREPLKGQTFAAAVVAGILAGGMGHATAHRLPLTLFVIAVGIIAAASPALSLLINFVPTSTGGSKLALFPAGAQIVAAARAGSLLPLSLPLPLDWLAGAFVGIPIGASWAAAIVERPAPAVA